MSEDKNKDKVENLIFFFFTNLYASVKNVLVTRFGWSELVDRRVFKENRCHESFLELLRVLFIYFSIKVVSQLLKLRRIPLRHLATEQRNISSSEVAHIY